MKGINKAILIGNIGHTPEVKVTDGGLTICKLTLATNRQYKGENEVTWHNITAFGKAGELIGQYTKKGDGLYVEGRISNTSYTGKDGTKKYRSEVIVDNFCFIGGGSEPRGEQRTAGEARGDLKAISEGLKENGIENEPEPDYDDDIPF